MADTKVIDLDGDHHIHTRFCNHALGDMEDYVEAAAGRGLQAVTFLEHLECGIRYDQRTWLNQEHFAAYFREGNRLRNKYRGKIAIRLGVEVGYNPASVPEIRDMLAHFPFEHIGLSYHFYFDGRRHLNMVSRRQDNVKALAAIGSKQVLNAYFDGLIRACDEIPCDKLCHLDAALRHLPGGIFLETHHRQQIEQLLQLMKKKEIGLEVNTSGIVLRGQPFPAKEFITRALDLDIQLVAGSDAHRPDQVGRGFVQLAELNL